MNLSNSLLSTIDLGSFSNLWFWLVLAVAWSNASHFVMGVPFDLVLRAKRRGGQDMDDLNTLAMIQARRRMGIMRSSGLWLVAFWMTILTLLGSLGFYYGFQLSQALVLLLGPLTLAGWIGVLLAAKVETGALRDLPLVKKIIWTRVGVQAIGLLTILVTTMWGMWQNLSVQVLGG